MGIHNYDQAFDEAKQRLIDADISDRSQYFNGFTAFLHFSAQFSPGY